MKINHESGVPLHLQVEQMLREMLEKPKYKEGALLPKEVDIANILGISRNTVRKSISKLVLEGHLVRKKGVGTKVSEKRINTQLESWMSFTQEMTSKGISFINYEIDVTFIKADKEVANALEIVEGKEVMRLSRLRGGEEGPFVYFVSYMHPRIGLTGGEDFKRPLYEILEKEFSILVYLSSETITAVNVDNNIASKLNINIDEPVLQRIRKVYDPGKRPIEYCLGYYRSDKFSYVIDITKS